MKQPIYWYSLKGAHLSNEFLNDVNHEKLIEQIVEIKKMLAEYQPGHAVSFVVSELMKGQLSCDS